MGEEGAGLQGEGLVEAPQENFVTGLQLRLHHLSRAPHGRHCQQRLRLVREEAGGRKGRPVNKFPGNDDRVHIFSRHLGFSGDQLPQGKNKGKNSNPAGAESVLLIHAELPGPPHPDIWGKTHKEGVEEVRPIVQLGHS